MFRVEQRGSLLAAIRTYFEGEDVLEVVTPLLRRHGVTDPYLQNIEVPGFGYLQTSPEYAMKELLAEHARSIYQICPAFRGGESGRHHRSEFQMLEWYRCGFTLAALMDDVAQLCLVAAGALGASGFTVPDRKTYRELFEAQYGLNPHGASLEQLLGLGRDAGGTHLDASSTRADCLDLLFSGIEPCLADPVFVTDYPACQAALARVEVNASGDQIARRFELYAAGLEIANAYDECNDSAELRRRLTANNQQRRAMGLAEMEIDTGLLDAVDRIPPCVGVALGVDRLVMVLTGTLDISEIA